MYSSSVQRWHVGCVVEVRGDAGAGRVGRQWKTEESRVPRPSVAFAAEKPRPLCFCGAAARVFHRRSCRHFVSPLPIPALARALPRRWEVFAAEGRRALIVVWDGGDGVKEKQAFADDPSLCFDVRPPPLAPLLHALVKRSYPRRGPVRPARALKAEKNSYSRRGGRVSACARLAETRHSPLSALGPPRRLLPVCQAAHSPPAGSSGSRARFPGSCPDRWPVCGRTPSMSPAPAQPGSSACESDLRPHILIPPGQGPRSLSTSSAGGPELHVAAAWLPRGGVDVKVRLPAWGTR